MASVNSEWILRIRDRVPNPPHSLIGVQRLIRWVLEAAPDAAISGWIVRRGAWGWGETVCALEGALGEHQFVVIELRPLLEALDAGEYFNDVQLEPEGMGIVVSVVDSTFLELHAPRDLVEECRRHFVDVEIIRQA